MYESFLPRQTEILPGADISTATRVRVFRASGEELPASLDYVAQTFDAKNGTRTMRAKIPADSGVLPGEFLRIRFMTAVDRGAWRVPQRCGQAAPRRALFRFRDAGRQSHSKSS